MEEWVHFGQQKLFNNILYLLSYHRIKMFLPSVFMIMYTRESIEHNQNLQTDEALHIYQDISFS